jgi:hypothetical protein
MKPKDISLKNTKQEILDAYEEILAQLKAGQTPSAPKFIKQADGINQLQADLHRQAEALKSSLTDSTDSIIRKLIEVTQALGQALEANNLLQDSYKSEEQKLKKIQAAQIEEFEYEFSKKRKRAETELAEAIAVKEKQLQVRENTLKDQETELVELRNQAKTFEARVAKAATDASVETEVRLKTVHAHEIAILKQQTESTQKLLQQKIELTSQTITSQQKEIDRLQKEVATANQQVTRIAERAVEKSPTYQPSSKE